MLHHATKRSRQELRERRDMRHDMLMCAARCADQCIDLMEQAKDLDAAGFAAAARCTRILARQFSRQAFDASFSARAMKKAARA